MDDGCVIVSAEYGSRALGVATAHSDRDVMSVFVEEPRQVTGIDPVGTVAGGTAAPGTRSARHDVDEVRYPLRKWAALAAVGNPTVLLLLFAPAYLTDSAEWGQLLAERDAFVSREAGHRFRGYAWSQREAMTGHRNTRTNRPELVHRHGFDTKFAYHLIRVALQGIELMETGGLVLPIAGEPLALLRAIRAGELSQAEVLALSDELDARLASATESSRLPEGPDRERINATLHRVYLSSWGRRGLLP